MTLNMSNLRYRDFCEYVVNFRKDHMISPTHQEISRDLEVPQTTARYWVLAYLKSEASDLQDLMLRDTVLHWSRMMKGIRSDLNHLEEIIANRNNKPSERVEAVREKRELLGDMIKICTEGLLFTDDFAAAVRRYEKRILLNNQENDHGKCSLSGDNDDGKTPDAGGGYSRPADEGRGGITGQTRNLYLDADDKTDRDNHLSDYGISDEEEDDDSGKKDDEYYNDDNDDNIQPIENMSSSSSHPENPDEKALFPKMDESAMQELALRLDKEEDSKKKTEKNVSESQQSANDAYDNNDGNDDNDGNDNNDNNDNQAPTTATSGPKPSLAGTFKNKNEKNELDRLADSITGADVYEDIVVD